MHDAVKYIHDHQQTLRDEHVRSDEAGLLTEPAREVLEKSAGLRLLQAKSHGGLEADPLEENDVAADNPETLARIEAILKQEHTPSPIERFQFEVLGEK